MTVPLKLSQDDALAVLREKLTYSVTEVTDRLLMQMLDHACPDVTDIEAARHAGYMAYRFESHCVATVIVAKKVGKAWLFWNYKHEDC